MLQSKETVKPHGFKRDHDQLKSANGSQSHIPSKKRKRGEDEESTGSQKKPKRGQLFDPMSTTSLAVKKSKSESETPKPGEVIGALIGKKRKLRKAKRGGG